MMMMRKIGHGAGMGIEMFLIEFSFESEEENDLSNLYGDETITMNLIRKKIQRRFLR